MFFSACSDDNNNDDAMACGLDKPCTIEGEICNDAGQCVTKTDELECSKFQACPDGLACDNGLCKAACSLTKPCKGGMVCNNAGICMPKDNLFQCGLNHACEDESLKCSDDHRCVACLESSDCRQGDCNAQGVCVQCSIDKDCATNDDGKNTCGANNKCVEGPPIFPGSVWTVTGSQRLLRSAPAEEAQSAKISAARNEWESFQIFVRASAAVKEIDVVAGPLTGPSGYVIDTDEMLLFRQHQMEILEGSARNDSFEVGWYPDPLIPFDIPSASNPYAPVRHQAVPFDLPANESHGFWIDVHVPSDAPAGQYHGEFKLTAGDTVTHVPLTLTVWDFTLPRLATLKTVFGSPVSVMRRYYTDREEKGIETAPTDWRQIDAQATEMLSRHRINSRTRTRLWPVKQSDGTYTIETSQVEALRADIDQYHVNAYDVSRPSGIFETPTSELSAWLAAWDEAIVALDRPDVQFYIYLKDEPNDEAAYAWVRTWGKPIIDTGTAVKVLVTEQTTSSNADWGDLYGAVNIWCPLFPIFDPLAAAKRQAKGEEIWAYTALAQRSPPTPWWQIDQPLLNYRVPAWIAWNFDIRGLLYWGGMSFWEQVDDPWINADTLVRDGSKAGQKLIYNGEGTLVYPGRAVGYEGFAESLRLKALRDAIEDYEYLSILKRAGKEAEARAIVSELTSSWFDWERDPQAYENARQALAELIVTSGEN